MARVRVLITVTVLLASGCVGVGSNDELDASSTDDVDDAPSTNAAEHELHQEAKLSFTHVATPASRHNGGENCMLYPEEPSVANLTGTIEVTWTPTTPAFERLQVRLISGFDVLGHAEGASPLTLGVDDATPTGDDLAVVVDPPRDPVGLAVEQEATLSVDLTYEADEPFEFETGWGCAYA